MRYLILTTIPEMSFSHKDLRPILGDVELEFDSKGAWDAVIQFGVVITDTHRKARLKAFELADRSEDPAHKGVLYEFRSLSHLKDAWGERVSTRSYVAYKTTSSKRGNALKRKWRIDRRKETFGRRSFVEYLPDNLPLRAVLGDLTRKQGSHTPGPDRPDLDQVVKTDTQFASDEDLLEAVRTYLESNDRRVVVSMDGTLVIERQFLHLYGPSIKEPSCGFDSPHRLMTKNSGKVTCPACRDSPWFKTISAWIE